jgi:hypothetical protein
MTTQPPSTLDMLIDYVEEQKRTAAAQRQAELDALNAERQAQAEHQLTAIFGSFAEAILPLVYERSPSHNGQGELERLHWRLGSHEQQLAPIELTWSAGGLNFGRPKPYITARVHTDGRDQAWEKNVTDEHIAEILYTARNAYPGYKAKVDKLEAQQRLQAINDLVTHCGFSASSSLDKIQPRIDKLRELDPQRAATEYENWKRRRIENLWEPYHWLARQPDTYVMPLYQELLLLLAPDQAEACLASWNQAKADQQQREIRKRAFATRLIELAKSYLQATTDYESACAEWVQIDNTLGTVALLGDPLRANRRHPTL